MRLQEADWEVNKTAHIPTMTNPSDDDRRPTHVAAAWPDRIAGVCAHRCRSFAAGICQQSRCPAWKFRYEEEHLTSLTHAFAGTSRADRQSVLTRDPAAAGSCLASAAFPASSVDGMANRSEALLGPFT